MQLDLARILYMYIQHCTTRLCLAEPLAPHMPHLLFSGRFQLSCIEKQLYTCPCAQYIHGSPSPYTHVGVYAVSIDIWTTLWLALSASFVCIYTCMTISWGCVEATGLVSLLAITHCIIMQRNYYNEVVMAGDDCTASHCQHSRVTHSRNTT